MNQLRNLTKSNCVCETVIEASGILQRAKGLLGRASLETDTSMWIQRCNSIHTFFMNFPIDVVFVDKDLKVKAIYRRLRPWRMTRPIFSASSVFELAEGVAAERDVEIGDQLYVGT